MAGSKFAVFFNYLNEIKANIILYNPKNHIFFRKKSKSSLSRIIGKISEVKQEGCMERLTDFFSCTDRLFQDGITYQLHSVWIVQRIEHRFVLTGIFVLYVQGKIKMTSLFHRLILLEEIADQAI